MELTKEYFESFLEQKLNKLEEKFDQKFEQMDQKIDSLDHKIDQQTVELKEYIHESFEVQQTYIDERFHELISNLRIGERLTQHDTWIHVLSNKIGVQLEV